MSVQGAAGVETSPAPRSSVPARPSDKEPWRFPWRLLALGAVLVGAFCFLLVRGLSGSLDYFETVDQAMSQKAMLGTRTFAWRGWSSPARCTVPGTVSPSWQRATADRVLVVNTGDPPQLFQPDIPVVVVGHFSGETFLSNQVIVDHSASYIEAHPKRVEAPNGTTR